MSVIIVQNRKESLSSHCPIGGCLIYWKDKDVVSQAVIGAYKDGSRWLACSEWSCTRNNDPTANLDSFWEDIEKIEFI